MADGATLVQVGDWQRIVKDALAESLAYSVEICGRTGEEACRHAMILMAQSAGKMTRRDRRTTRPVLRDGNLPYVEIYNQESPDPRKLYKWHAEQYIGPDAWTNARKIGNLGLAKRSWLWGLGRLGAGNVGAAIPGTSSVATIKGENLVGYVKQNRLSYINKIMPAGWEGMVAALAGNKIMKQAAIKLERNWRSALGRGRKRGARLARLGQSFLR